MYKRFTISAGTSIILGKVSPLYASLPEVFMELSFPLSSLSGLLSSRTLFGAAPNYYRRSLQYLFTQRLVLGRSLTFASLPEVSLEIRTPRDFSLEFSAIEVSLWRCPELLPEVSSVSVCAGAIVGEVSPTYASLPEISL